jgi:hypothetical protein
MLRGEVWTLFESIAQRNKIAAGALSCHALYACRTALGADYRFDSSYLCSLLYRMDAAIRVWEGDRTKPANHAHKREKLHFTGFSTDHIQAIVVLVKRAHDHVDRYNEAVAPLLLKLQRAHDPVHEDVKKLLRGDFDESLKDFTDVGIYPPLATLVTRLEEEVKRLPKSAAESGSDAADSERTEDDSDASSRGRGVFEVGGDFSLSTEEEFSPSDRAAVATLKVSECVSVCLCVACYRAAQMCSSAVISLSISAFPFTRRAVRCAESEHSRRKWQLEGLVPRNRRIQR